jgi:nucleoside 2-deoxyribosyltransferase
MTGDIGSAWECGYAYAKGKKILVQFLGKQTDKISLMVANSTHIELTMYQS